jgi:hypothetical protein
MPVVGWPTVSVHARGGAATQASSSEARKSFPQIKSRNGANAMAVGCPIATIVEQNDGMLKQVFAVSGAEGCDPKWVRLIP